MLKRLPVLILNLLPFSACANEVAAQSMFASEDAALEMARSIGPDWSQLKEPIALPDSIDADRLVRRLSRNAGNDLGHVLDVRREKKDGPITEVVLGFPKIRNDCPTREDQLALVRIVLNWLPGASPNDETPFNHIARAADMGWNHARIGASVIATAKVTFTKGQSYCSVAIARGIVDSAA